MTAFDYAAIIVFLASTLLIGSLSFSRRPSADDFFFAGRAMNRWWIATSLMATSISTLTLVAFVGEFVRTGLDFMILLVGLPAGMALVNRIAVPAYYRTERPTTIFAYLRERFGRVAEIAVTVVFCGSRLVWVAMIYYTSSAIIAPVAGWNQYVVMAVVGLVSIGYVTAGGIRADIRTDLIQGIVMFVTMGLVAVFLTGALGKGGHWEQLAAQATFHSRIWSFDPHGPSLTAILIWAIAISFSSFAASQVNAQIYFCSGNRKSAQKSLRRSMWMTVVMVALTAWVGLFLSAYFSGGASPFSGRIAESADGLLAFFVSQKLPDGMLGLFICGMLAAAMSSVDSVFQALNTMYQVNFRGRTAEDLTKISISWKYRIRAGGFAVLALLVATGVSTLKGSLLSKAATLCAAFDGPLAGVFLVAFCWKRARGRDVLVGAIAGLASWGVMVSGASVFGIPRFSIYWILPGSMGATAAAAIISSLFKGRTPSEPRPSERVLG